jgi:hypothetical protein
MARGRGATIGVIDDDEYVSGVTMLMHYRCHCRSWYCYRDIQVDRVVKRVGDG